jgi:chemotaxis protein CheZ
MNMNELSAVPAASPEVFQRLGTITRQLHDTLGQLGLMPRLQNSVDGLTDARSRLSYIARKTGEAAEKVLTAVELAKHEQDKIRLTTQAIGVALAAQGSPGAVQALVAVVEDANQRVGAHLTDIMMAQDFHDLTGQVVGKVVALAIDLEDSLVKLLLQAAPQEQFAEPAQGSGLNGPVVDPTQRSDVVSSQGEVDDLLASLGF